jgi:hypothetical protein
MESRKEVKKKINVFKAMHYIMAAWQQINQQTIQNCFRKAGCKYQLDGNEMANDDDDDFGQDWEELCRAQKYEDENEQEMVPSFAEAYEALEKVKVFFYAQSVSDADRENILSLEKSHFQLRQNSAKKQKTMYDFSC